MVSQKKLTQLQEIVQALQTSGNFALVKFEKTTHQSLEALRKELKKSASTFKVLKNTLLQKAVNKLSPTNKLFGQLKKDFFPLRENSALLAFAGDWSAGLNAFYKFIQNEKTLDFKFALLDGKIYPKDDVLKIAQLPGKNELMATVIGSLKNPVVRFLHSLKFNNQKFIFIMKGVKRYG